jgi:ABC-type nitrate/sulfonate/bicarbonate transport system substrate-binding protein
MIDSNPLTAVVSMQQTTIEQTNEAVSESIKAQKEVASTFADNLDAVEQAQRQGSDLSRDAVESYLDVVESIYPDADVDELRTNVEDQFDAFEKTHEQQWEAISEITEDSLDGIEEAADTYAEFVDSSFDSFLEAHEQVGETASEATEQTIETASELADETTPAN